MLGTDVAPTGLTGCFHNTVPALTPLPPGTVQAMRDLPPLQQVHDRAQEALPAFQQVELGGEATAPVPPGPLRLAAWNLERCLYPEAAAAALRRHGVSLALLSEMDHGLHRTGQRHTTRDVAGLLGHRYGYALEFLELAVMPAPIVFPGNAVDNRLGFHGNGFSTALPVREPVVIRLPREADWYIAPKGGQRRIGNRMAVAATFTHEGRDFIGCAVHLESATDFAGRARQMAFLLDELELVAHGLPIVIGGDLNTGVEGEGALDDPRELLFADAIARGYDWSACNLARPTTRRSTWSEGAGTRQLDWFCTRGFRASAPEVVPALAEDGTVLTDHELILVSLDFA
ncbi:endonuclease/exonuclease/phosphatase family protein [Acetobacteraceae bacterium AT-5844]|nr:endonuclease/exonuclease/phosphatase family protein [Acetobacteraceae bacterium AT-5844]